MSFGEKLRALRLSAGLTQAQLAERSGLHQMGISKLEQGAREPTLATAQAIATALGVSLSVFDGCDNAPSGDRPGPGRPAKD